jgi:23S rRNA maturation-related 3'-5' exoribonuclease YhaM
MVVFRGHYLWEVALPRKASNEMDELAKELEDLLHGMTREQLQRIVDHSLGEEPDAMAAAKRFARMELARRLLH